MRAGVWRSSPSRGGVVLALLVLGILSQACSSKLVPYGEGATVGFRHRDIGYKIALPDWGEIPAWERYEIEGVDLAFRDSKDGGRSNMSLLSQCRDSGASPQVLARHLTIGLSESQVLRSGPVALAGDPGWSQTFVTRQEGTPAQVKSVTVVSLPCVFDWVLVMPGNFGRIESIFDRWWASFEFHAEGAEAGRQLEVAR